MRRELLLATLLCSACSMNPPPTTAHAPAAGAEPAAVAEEATAPAPAPIAYPATRTADVAEEQFGVVVADPYRWLENDVRNDAEVAGWVEAQNKVTNAFLDTLPLQAAFEKRLTELYDYERFGVPVKKGGHYFYTHNTGLQNQSVLFVRDSVDGEGRQLIDPNLWSKDGATALAEWTPSEDGKLLAYSIQDGGTDWRVVRVMDVASGKLLDDELKWLKYSGDVAWAKDGKGFYYSRFPEPAKGQTYQEQSLNQSVWYHRLGTPQSADRKVFATPGLPKRGHHVTVSDDGRWLIISTGEGTDNVNEVRILDLSKKGSKPRALITGLDHEWSYVGNKGSTFFFRTDSGAPMKRIVTIDVARSAVKPVTVVPEQQSVIAGSALVGDKLVATYLVDAKTEARVFALDGTPVTTLALPGIGDAGGFSGKLGDEEGFFYFTSFNRPTTIYRYDSASGAVSPWAAPKVAFNPDDFTVEQRFYASKDGTRVPMFIVRKKGSNGPAPTLLYGYGGFDISLTPAFSASNLAWVDRGGTYVVANIRGGGEYGKAWHEAGRLKNKQNVFDDFIAAGEYLKANGIAAPDGLAIRGGSNGGLLVGAVVNQRPDLFDAATAAVGVMDMLRFDRWTAGRYWVDDYGHPDREEDFRILHAYSPYHNIKGGRAYPPLLVTTADTDDRVVPGHSFKYIAMLQNTGDVGDSPHLIRIETRAGHGSGKPISKIIEETADVFAFLGHFTGLDQSAK